MDIKLCEEKNSKQYLWPKFKLISSFEILLLLNKKFINLKKLIC
jgi:hypothetical protein